MIGLTSLFHRFGDQQPDALPTLFKEQLVVASGQGGNLVPLNGLEVSGSRQFKPTLEGCEGETYYGMTLQLPLPAESSVGKYYAFHTEHNGDTVYGWIQPTSFNGGGITFNFVTYEPSSSPPWTSAR